MPDALIECIPNFSEGRDEKKISAIAAAVKNTPQIKFLDLHSDIDHNRSVITFMGSPLAVKTAAYNLAAKAFELIDISKHEGVHPFIGAVDVMPFVPLKNSSIDDCCALAKDLGQMIWKNFQVPVYFYGYAAQIEARKDLAYVRKGGYKTLVSEIKNPKRVPDIGNSQMHPTAGAIAIGARDFLIAYNINLKSDNLEAAKEIAKSIREKNGGLQGVKALGVFLPSRNIAQVTVNITNHRETTMDQVLSQVEKKAREKGIEILDTEIVGLLPKDLPV